MTSAGWHLDDIDWARFDASRVDPEILKIVKAASLVEFNGEDYGAYLCNVFPDDPVFQDAAMLWAHEEVQHGQALGRWAQLADPDWDFEAAVARFRAGYRIDIDAEASVRGTRAGELVARCMVETGTSSYYTALAQAVEEPVLADICRRIAADELRHYKMFYDHLKRYVERDRLSRLQRLRVALGRILEAEDDELAYAYYAGNVSEGAYCRKTHGNAYLSRAYRFYRQDHVDRVVRMVFKACGFRADTWPFRMIRRGAWWILKRRAAVPV